MKLKDFFSKIGEQGGFSGDDFKKFVDGLPDGDVPDDVFKQHETAFLTKERAATDPDIVGRLRVEHLNPINRDLQKMLSAIDNYDKYTSSEIARLTRKVGKGDNEKEVPDTYKQLEALTNSLPKIIEKMKVAPSDEETKKALADKEKVLQELNQKFVELEKGKEASIKKIHEEYQKKDNDRQVDFMLENLVNSYTFADAYKDTKSTLTKALINDLKKGQILALATKENGDPFIDVQEIKDGIARTKFNGNTPVTIKSLLDSTFEPFLKKNNSGDDGSGGQNQQQHNQQQSFRVGGDGKTAPRQGASVSVTV